jgi:fucose permease
LGVSRRATAATLVLASAGFVSLGLPEGLLGVAWPSIRADFGISLDALGLLLATAASGYAVASTVSGRVLKRFGVGEVLAVSCATTGTALIGYSLAPSWPAMVVLGAILGAGGGMIDAALNVYAAISHGPRVLNWMHAAFGFGAAIGPLIMTAVITSGLPWTAGYVGVACAQLGLAVGYALLRRRFSSAMRPAAAGPSRHDTAALARNPLVWLSVAIFFVYAGIEVAAGQWSFSLFTEARGMSTTTAGIWVSAYWASLTVGRILFGIVVNHVPVDALLRGCMLACIVASALVWLNAGWALAVIGLMLAPIFPSLIAATPMRLGERHTADAVGWEVGAAVLGGALLPGGVGVLAARVGLEVVGLCLVVGASVLLALHEVLVRLSPASAPRRSARSQTDAVASPPQGA